MPFFDRFWWSRLLIALFLLLSAVAIPARYLNVLASLGRVGKPDLLDFVSAAGLLIALVAVAVWLGRSASRARTRQEQRLAALAGDRDAMPQLYMDDDSKSDSKRQDPLFIYWRSPWYHRFITSVIYGLIALPLAGFLASLVLLYVASLIFNYSRAQAQLVAAFPLPLMLFLLWVVYFLRSDSLCGADRTRRAHCRC